MSVFKHKKKVRAVRTRFTDPRIMRSDMPKFKVLLSGSLQRLGSKISVTKEFGISTSELEIIMGSKSKLHVQSVSTDCGRKILNGFRKIKHLPKIHKIKMKIA